MPRFRNASSTSSMHLSKRRGFRPSAALRRMRSANSCGRTIKIPSKGATFRLALAITAWVSSDLGNGWVTLNHKGGNCIITITPAH